MTATYTAKDDGDIKVENRGKYFGLFYTYVSGSARCSSEGQCFVNFGDQSYMEGDTNYNVISTDYDTYSLVYSCSSAFFGLMKTESMWMLTRETEITDEVANSIKEKMEETVPGYAQWFW